jgi:hypothetical protein
MLGAIKAEIKFSNVEHPPCGFSKRGGGHFVVCSMAVVSVNYQIEEKRITKR